MTTNTNNGKRFDETIFWIDVEKIEPNPYQPRKHFDEAALEALADSIRQYGVLQPLVVTRKEIVRDDGGMQTLYELIAGERRLRASRLAGVGQVPAVIRTDSDSNEMKLELAIIENLQREDINPIDRAEAFAQLAKEFSYTHGQIAKKIGRSRVYVANSIRLLGLPEHIKEKVRGGELSEGHARPMLMLSGHPEQQDTLLKDILLHKISVRDAERYSRKIATDRVRKFSFETNPDIANAEEELREQLGTRVQIEKKKNGGKITIDFYTPEDLQAVMERISANKELSMRVAGAVAQDVVKDKMDSVESSDQKTNEAIALEETELNEESEDTTRDDGSSLYSVTEFTL